MFPGDLLIRLYNTLTRRLEPVSLSGPAIRIYFCGITPYDTTHLGHAFTYTSADLLVRALEARGGRVVYAQNVTDIDDDILRRAALVGEDWRQLGDRWTRHFIDDMLALNVRPPDHYPRASDVIPEIIQSVEALLAAGLAYASGSSVYYDLAARPQYGALSRLSRTEMLPVANTRGNHPDDPNKRDPLDFVLWQAQKEGEPAWPSPWGPGRPGWHIECSTMVGKYLGENLEIHGGGEDLIFPHHESEIAQIEPLTGRPFARHWMHISMVRHAGEKMSKSLGNLVMVEDLLGRGSADGVRWYLASHHYRSVWTHDGAELERSEQAVRRLEQACQVSGRGAEIDAEAERGEFRRALDEDLDSPAALGVLTRLGERIRQAAQRGDGVGAAQRILRELGGQLGLRLGETGPEARVAQGWQRHRLRFPTATTS